MPENTKDPKTPGDAPSHEPLMNTGPDAIIGYSVETGEPPTKREVFGEGDRVGEAPNTSSRGPRSWARTARPRAPPSPRSRSSRRTSPRPTARPTSTSPTPAPASPAGAAKRSRASAPTPPNTLDPAENPSLELTDWQTATGGRIPVRLAPEDGTEALSPEEREAARLARLVNDLLTLGGRGGLAVLARGAGLGRVLGAQQRGRDRPPQPALRLRPLLPRRRLPLARPGRHRAGAVHRPLDRGVPRGDIRLESELGRGTAAFVRLPLEAPPG